MVMLCLLCSFLIASNSGAEARFDNIEQGLAVLQNVEALFGNHRKHPSQRDGKHYKKSSYPVVYNAETQSTAPQLKSRPTCTNPKGDQFACIAENGVWIVGIYGVNPRMIQVDGQVLDIAYITNVRIIITYQDRGAVRLMLVDVVTNKRWDLSPIRNAVWIYFRVESHSAIAVAFSGTEYFCYRIDASGPTSRLLRRDNIAFDAFFTIHFMVYVRNGAVITVDNNTGMERQVGIIDAGCETIISVGNSGYWKARFYNDRAVIIFVAWGNAGEKQSFAIQGRFRPAAIKILFDRYCKAYIVYAVGEDGQPVYMPLTDAARRTLDHLQKIFPNSPVVEIINTTRDGQIWIVRVRDPGELGEKYYMYDTRTRHRRFLGTVAQF
jgi:hypothetical protein